MTGYGIASKDHANAKYTVEIKSLNSKFLELALKLPKAFSDKELILRNDCSKQIERGKVNIAFTIEYPENEKKTASIDSALLKLYYQQLKASAEELNDNGNNLLQLALNFPEVIKYDEDIVSEEEWQQLYSTFSLALANFQTFRADEGNVLQRDLILRINNILEALKQVEEQDPKRLPVIRERLMQLLDEYVGKENTDQNRLEQELIFYIDKLDITEEKIRLKSHCDYFLQALKSSDANGKKLGFISQEIGREINTMGSKANDARIQQIVVGMKEELEKVKEQLLNVL
ncbi:YicC/YloC family endoribonuclease [Arcticibacter tournemirensis]|uniref:YicC family protein n=1 Tax=Arcticibacter tournemirensis TaxID=699437 RepID=A0A4Q0M5J1_9SPHI|nr:YicC/YloC family endoribonuclease [Arcticibacter tournemirensis]RXF68063.1 YicC family protein [Arcticibacter tournemirensis]